MKKTLIIILTLCAVASADNVVGLGLRLEGGLGGSDRRPGSGIFGGEYSYFSGASGFVGSAFTGGLTLNIRATNVISLSSGAAYRFLSMTADLYPESNRRDSVEARVRDHALAVPVLLRVSVDGIYAEGGVEWAFPFSSNARVRHGGRGINDRHSGFRAARDFNLVVGGGVTGESAWAGARIIIPMTRLDTHNAINNPILVSFMLDLPLFGF